MLPGFYDYNGKCLYTWKELEDQGFHIEEDFTKGYVNMENIAGTLVLPSYIKKIGKRALSDSKITKIVLPDGLEEINGGAFYRCERFNLETGKMG